MGFSTSTLNCTGRPSCAEMNRKLFVRIKPVDSVGHLAMRIELNPGVDEGHWFTEEGLDQTFLPPLIQQCAALLKRYHVNGRDDR